MIPELKINQTSEFLKLENIIIRNSCEIEQWFRGKWLDYKAPFYSSVDLRNSGFKLSPVDTNLFPAGFNNLNPQFDPLAIQAATFAIEKVCPEASKIIIIPENHSRNIFYFKNLIRLIEILKNAGLEIELGSLDPNFKETKFRVDENCNLQIYPIIKEKNRIFIYKDNKKFIPCSILLNNDLSSGNPSILKDITQTILPSVSAGWFNRRKSDHFTIYNHVAKDFSDFLNIDPWLINPYFDVHENFDINNQEDLLKISSKSEILIKKIKLKYKQYQISHDPYLVIKADSGTYGMGVITINNPDEIFKLNRKKRNKMSTIKDGQKITNVIIQEGIHTEEYVNDSVSEPVVYTIDHFVIGGFYRIHTNKGKNENLNSPGMEFIPTPFEQSCLMPDQGRDCNDPPNRFYVYGVIARLALLAAAGELNV
jgi:glutamate--cysteine ligase